MNHSYKRTGNLGYQNIYEKVWNAEYDKDWDAPTLKTAVYRLRQQLKPLQNLIRLVPMAKNGQRGLELRISGKWDALL